MGQRLHRRTPRPWRLLLATGLRCTQAFAMSHTARRREFVALAQKAGLERSASLRGKPYSTWHDHRASFPGFVRHEPYPRPAPLALIMAHLLRSRAS